MNDSETSAKARQTPLLMPGPKGGQLRRGNPGNRGGGRLSKKVLEIRSEQEALAKEAREKALREYINSVTAMSTIAKNEEAAPEDRIAAVAELRKGAGLEESPAVQINDNRSQVDAKIVYLPQLGVEVQQLPAEIAE